MSDIKSLLKAEAEAAEEYEANHPDAPLPEHVKVTRPGHARSRMMSFRLNPDEADTVQAAAQAAGVPASTLVRGWVLRGLDSDREDSATAIVEHLAHDVERLRKLVS